MVGRRKPVEYINNKDLLRHLIEWKDEYNAAKAAGTELPRIPKYVGEGILLIAQRFATKGNFSGYSFKEDMIGDGYENCVRYLHNFNPEKSKNPFGYISLIIKNAFVRRIEREAQHSYIRHKLMVGASNMFDADSVDPSDMNQLDSMLETMSNDKSSDIIENFERKVAKKRDRARANASAR